MEGHTFFSRWLKVCYKKSRQGPCLVVWDEKQLSDKNVYKEVNFDEKLMQDLTETSNKIFRNLKNGGFCNR